MNYDPVSTLRDKPRRSSLPSHHIAVTNYRRGSVIAPNAAAPLPLPVARRPSEVPVPVPAPETATEKPTTRPRAATNADTTKPDATTLWVPPSSSTDTRPSYERKSSDRRRSYFSRQSVGTIKTLESLKEGKEAPDSGRLSASRQSLAPPSQRPSFAREPFRSSFAIQRVSRTESFAAGSTAPAIVEEEPPSPSSKRATGDPTFLSQDPFAKAKAPGLPQPASLSARRATSTTTKRPGWQWPLDPKGPSLFESQRTTPPTSPLEPPSPTTHVAPSALSPVPPSLGRTKSDIESSPATLTSSLNEAGSPTKTIATLQEEQRVNAPDTIEEKVGEAVPTSAVSEGDQLPWYQRIPFFSWLVRGIMFHFHWRFILSILSPRSYFWPMTFKKAAYWLFYSGFIVAVVLLEHFYGWSSHVFDVVKFKAWPLAVFLFCLDPVACVYYCSIAPVYQLLPECSRPDWPLKAMRETELAELIGQIESTDTKDVEAQGAPVLVDSNMADAALVIPCHNSDLDTFPLVLSAALRVFPPGNIFVVENGNSPSPPDWAFYRLVREINENVNYIWSPIGNKNVSEYVGAMAAHGFKYCATIDDDVVLPANFAAPVHLITEKVKGVCYPILAVPDRPDGSKSTFVQWQECEYIFTGLLKAAERSHGSVAWPHGAASFWERQTFIDVLRRVDLIFYADDLKKGMACMELDVSLSIETQCPVETVVPLSFMGLPLPNYWTQRVRSWEMSRHMLYWRWLSCVLFRWPRNQRFWTIATHKFILCYALFANLMDWLRLPAIVIFSFHPTPFWAVSAPLILLPIAPALMVKYWKARHRPDLRNDLHVCLTMPIYKLMYSLVSIAGLLRVFFTYFPNRKRIPMIPELEARTGDARPFWLDERFKDKPGYLAVPPPSSEDEEEEEEQEQLAPESHDAHSTT